MIGLGVGLFLLIAMLSLQAGRLVMGPFGNSSAGLFYGLAGIPGYCLIALGLVAAVRTLLEREPVMPILITVGVVIGVVSLATLVHLGAPTYRVAGHGPGGAIGEHLAEVLRAVISTAGTALLALIGLVVAVVVATPLRMREVLRAIGHGLAFFARGIQHGVFAFARFWADVFRAILPGKDNSRDDDEDEEDDVLEVGEDDGVVDPLIIEKTEKKSRKKKPVQATEIDLAPPGPIVVEGETVEPDVILSPKPPKRSRMAHGTQAPEIEEAKAEAAAKVEAPKPEPDPAGGPMIVESRFKHADKAEMAKKEQAAEAERQSFIKLGEGDYKLPSIQLLKYDASSQNTIDKSAMLELSAKLTQTLENYGVKGDVVAIRPGPVVTMYEFAPAPGTRVNKITNLTDDLALALEALRVRIVAPIPGKAAVGIEVPNKTREKVFLKEILADEAFVKGRAKLPIALGKDIEGGPSVVDLARMPHLLVAGTTGSGKSVAVNAFITSLLYHCSPEDVRMIMVDPKMLELSIYEGVPHLLLPVVTDPKKANLALRWAVEEMDRRYDLLAQMGVRDIGAFNDKVGKQLAKLEADKLKAAADAAAAALEDDIGKVIAADSPEEADAREKVSSPLHRLPYIVVVIDEFADLMMCAPKEVETSVARIAQKARASGIHLILATQRPSVDVITGLIKANFPSRIAFSVASKIDSRTILDQSGAEALLGAGDMLFSDRGAAPQRLHGCYVDEEEIHKVVEFLKTQGRPVYNLDILKPREEEGDGGDMQMPSGKSDDDMYDKAVYIVTTTRNASISWVQRQLRIGYNRAARLVEEMEKQGVVSPPDHTNKREVLVAHA
ncbi:MAG: DNA translocase FtsK 4TM domain-containing protein [Myxococcota bacterium]|nr:DNA translocase FtsK 4TM domain-containing protein [Deltaproteobacteria bacterium]MDQ3337896.1 DNA translocase FtsK 4TM domain-containing protein [Myxococcota bacterium]